MSSYSSTFSLLSGNKLKNSHNETVEFHGRIDELDNNYSFPNETDSAPVGGSDNHSNTGTSIPTVIFGSLALMVIWWCMQPRVPPPRLAEQARRLRQQRLRRKRWSDPRKRWALLNQSLYVQQVVRAESGQLTLGPVSPSIPAADTGTREAAKIDTIDDVATSTSSADFPPSAVAPGSTVNAVSYSRLNSAIISQNAVTDGTISDDDSNMISANTSAAVSMSPSSSWPSGPDILPRDDDGVDDDSMSCCVICLEPFRIGDLVAWSRPPVSTNAAVDSPTAPSSDSAASGARPDSLTSTDTTPESSSVSAAVPCHHVFHRDCILSWLQNPKHDDCPSCRTVILRYPPLSDLEEEQENEDPGPSTDDDGSRRRTLSDMENGLGHPDNDGDDDGVAGLYGYSYDDLAGGGNSSMAFVIMHGLVSQVRRASYTLMGQSLPDAGHRDEGDDLDGHDDGLPGSSRSAPDAHQQGSWRRAGATLTSLSEPADFRRVFSWGGGSGLATSTSLPRRPSASAALSYAVVFPKRLSLSSSMRRRRSVGWRSTSESSAPDKDPRLVVLSGSDRCHPKPPFLPLPSALRRTVSAGPGSPLRRTSSGAEAPFQPPRDSPGVRFDHHESELALPILLQRTSTGRGRALEMTSLRNEAVSSKADHHHDDDEEEEDWDELLCGIHLPPRRAVRPSRGFNQANNPEEEEEEDDDPTEEDDLLPPGEEEEEI